MKEMRAFFYQEQVGKLLNASVLLSINEVELSIYRFLSSRVKNNKRQPRPVDLGSTGSLAVGAFNA